MTTIRCRMCGEAMEVPDDGLGHRVRCGRCGATFELPETGVRYADAGYRVTFGAFVSLLHDADRDRLNERVFRQVELTLAAQGALTDRTTGRRVTAADAHRIVQAHQQAQYWLYQIGMDLWR